MKRPSLLLITNPKNEDPEEDQMLGAYLDKYFDVTYADPVQAVEMAAQFDICLIRNAWPSHEFADALRALAHLIAKKDIIAYNPIGWREYVENKHYLLQLFEEGYPVIPTVDRLSDLAKLGTPKKYLTKPMDWCSGIGVATKSREELMKEGDVPERLVQPEIDFVDERSFFFINNQFSYALVSAGKGKRWDLREFAPSDDEIKWAERFVKWNGLEYGLVRIDACRTKDGTLLLMEIEDQMPFLSFDILTPATRGKVCEGIARALLRLVK